jgi:stage V sporulation protein SpoVS
MVQVAANMLTSPLTGHPLPWVAFSYNPEAVRAANEKGLPVYFGDGSNPTTLAAVTSKPPKAFVLTHRSHPQLLEALDNVCKSFPTVPKFALTIDIRRAAEVQQCGATAVVTRANAGVALGDAVLRGLMSTSFVDLVFLEQEMQLAVRDAVETASLDKARHDSQGEPRMRENQAGMLILDTYPSQVSACHQNSAAIRTAGVAFARWSV